MKVTIGQKSGEVLGRIRQFLSVYGIHSVIYSPKRGVKSLDIGRVDDLVRFLKSVRAVVKQGQVVTALSYLGGRISGNTLLQAFDHEYRKHKRKGNPMDKLGLKFPLTRYQAVELARVKGAEARLKANRRNFLLRMESRVKALPGVFDVKDIQGVLGVSRGRAQGLARMMEKQRLVRCRYERVPPRFHKLVCERISPEPRHEKSSVN